MTNGLTKVQAIINIYVTEAGTRALASLFTQPADSAARLLKVATCKVLKYSSVSII